MNESSQLRLGGWAGIIFSVLSLAVIPLVVAPPPALGATGTAFVDYYLQHRTGFLIGNYLGIAAFFPGFLQLVMLVNHIRRKEGEDGWIASLVLSTGTFAYAVFACSLVVFQALPFLVDSNQSEAMGTLGSVWFALDGLAALPFVMAIGWACLRAGVFARWLGYASYLAALLAIVMSLGGLTYTPAWLAGGGPATMVGFVSFFAWTFAIGLVLLSESRKV